MLALKARCDGKRIVLPRGAKLPVGGVIVVFQGDETDDERDLWQGLSVQGLASAYGKHEPDYSVKLVKETNPEYRPSKKGTSS